VQVASLSGILSTTNAQYELNPANAAETQGLSLLKQRFLWGKPVVEKIIQSLNQAGIKETVLREVKRAGGSDGVEVHLPGRNGASIQVFPEGSTHVFARDHQTRNLLKAIVIEQLVELG